MNINSEVIILLCSNIAINQNVNPFSSSEWSRFAEKLMNSGLTPSSLISMSVAEYNRLLNLTYKECERIEKLLARKKLLFSELKKYADMGIYVITRADAEYPKMLKSKLKQNSPPLFYCFGDVNILKRDCAGFVGSRNINDNDIKFIEGTGYKINY
ncbi:MAG: DNA-processing protein DprA [Ruminococcus sp.]|nr:DNA-processing protein DprA [Ruminococcus sp.]